MNSAKLMNPEMLDPILTGSLRSTPADSRSEPYLPLFPAGIAVGMTGRPGGKSAAFEEPKLINGLSYAAIINTTSAPSPVRA